MYIWRNLSAMLCGDKVGSANIDIELLQDWKISDIHALRFPKSEYLTRIYSLQLAYCAWKQVL